MLNSVTNNAAAPIQKQAVQNQTNSGSDFQQVLSASNISTDESRAMRTFSGEIKIPDGSLTVVEPVKIQVFTHDESLELLEQTGMTKAEAEEILKPKDLSQFVSKEQTPQEMKAYLMSEKIEAMVRDKTGNVVAILYKNGSSMNLGYDGGTSPTEKLSKLEKDSNVTVTHYQNFSSFDMLKEQVAQQEKIPKQSIIYNTQEERDFYNTQQEVFEFQKRILAA
ncbi:MAG: hypothetical protein RL236_658 [Pseudomonadota bacterium]